MRATSLSGKRIWIYDLFTIVIGLVGGSLGGWG